MKSLITMTQSRLAKGKTRAIKYTKKPTPMNSQRYAVKKNSPISAKAMSPRKPIQGGEYSNDRNRTCRVVKYPTENTFAAVSSRSVQFRPDFAAAVGASAA